MRSWIQDSGVELVPEPGGHYAITLPGGAAPAMEYRSAEAVIQTEAP